MTVRARPVGERSRLVELSDRERVHHLWAAWTSRRDPDVEELVAGALSILVTVREGADPDRVLDRLAGSPAAPAPAEPTEVDIPVEYAGEDLEEVGRLTGLGPDGVVRSHSAAVWTVSFLGFSPGFAYLSGGDAVLEVPRLDRPRTAVPAGSVALAAGWSAVYPQSTPGGWRLIGRTEAVMFDPGRSRPALLAPGDRVRFRPVRRRVVAAAPAAAPTSGPLPSPPPAGEPGAYLRVIDPGPLLTVQDLGRVGWAHLGAPRAGAADRASARSANELVGNQPGAAVLEATAAGPHLLVGSARTVAVTGGRAQVTVDGIPARQHAALAVPAGAVVAAGPVEPGLRIYVAVAGGIGVDPVLGSRSTDTLSGLGPPPLRRGDVLALGPVPASGPAAPGVRPTRPPLGGPLVLRAHTGPRHDRIGPEGMAVLAASEFVVEAAIDRTGVRLGGPPVPVAVPGEIPSEPMVAGAVQIPHGGHPIVLLRNHPTTGGYPVAAVVDDAGVDRLAQARPGDRVRFELVPP